MSSKYQSNNNSKNASFVRSVNDSRYSSPKYSTKGYNYSNKGQSYPYKNPHRSLEKSTATNFYVKP